MTEKTLSDVYAAVRKLDNEELAMGLLELSMKMPRELHGMVPFMVVASERLKDAG